MKKVLFLALLLLAGCESKKTNQLLLDDIRQQRLQSYAPGSYILIYTVEENGELSRPTIYGEGDKVGTETVQIDLILEGVNPPISDDNLNALTGLALKRVYDQTTDSIVTDSVFSWPGEQ